MKNKYYLMIIIVLLPIALLTKKKESIEIKTNEEENTSILLKLDNEIISLPLEDYIIGVVGAEMPASFFDEALKAQAVASRTFTLYEMQEKVYMTLSDQAYLTEEGLKEKWQDKYEVYLEKVKNAVETTKNEIMIYEGQIIKSYYYAMSNGYTEDAMAVFNESLPYLVSVESAYDNESLNRFLYTTSFTIKEFCNKLNLSSSTIEISNITKDDSGRVESITINNKIFSGVKFRNLLGLRSTDFTLSIKEDTVDITTKGYGHGVGMSQYGANGMAKEGYNYQEILKYYYTGIEITNY